MNKLSSPMCSCLFTLCIIPGLLFLVVSGAAAQTINFTWYPTDDPTAVGTCYAGTETTFEAITSGSSYSWRFANCTFDPSACKTGQTATWTYPIQATMPYFKYVQLTVDGYSQNKQVTIEMPPYTVIVIESLGGQVTGPPGAGDGIACGSGSTVCQEDYPSDSGVTLTAVPDSGWLLTEWQVNGEFAGSDMELVITAEEQTVQAFFEPETLTIVSTPPEMWGRVYEYAVKVMGPFADKAIFELLTAPDGMAIDRNNGTIRWQPAEDQLGTHQATVQADNQHGLTDTQPLDLTVTDQTFDRMHPVVTLTITPEQVFPNDQVTITMIAEDNVAVVTSTLTVNDEPLTPDGNGTAVYTPTQAGEYVVTAFASDAAGYETTVTKQFWARGTSASLRFLEGFDPERGATAQDHIVLPVSTQNTMNNTTDILHPETEPLFASDPSIDFYLEYVNESIVFVLTEGVTAVLLQGVAYDSVTSAGGLTLTEWPSGEPVQLTDDTVVLQTIDGAYFKVGEFQFIAAEGRAQFSYQELQE